VIHKQKFSKCVALSIIITALVGGFPLFVLFSDCAWSREEVTVTEYDVKAAFLLNFVRFVDWSDRMRGDTDKELILGIAGEDRFGNALNLIRGAKVKSRTLVIKNVVDSNSLINCDILFISSSEKDRLPTLMAALKDLPILTVSEIEGFAQRGGIINFITVEKKIRFEINPDAAKQVGIHISSQLLQLARIVTDE
jgi:hypothetical protein